MIAAGSPLKTLFAFTRDLRVDDHLGLAQAAQLGEVVPVLVSTGALGPFALPHPAAPRTTARPWRRSTRRSGPAVAG